MIKGNKFRGLLFILFIFFVIGLVSDLHSQHFVVLAPFTVGTSNFSDSIKLANRLKEVGDFCLAAYDLNTVDVGIGAFRCSEQEPEYLWMERRTKFVKLLYELQPRFKTMPMSIYFDPGHISFRELYLTEDEEIGASFLMINKK